MSVFKTEAVANVVQGKFNPDGTPKPKAEYYANIGIPSVGKESGEPTFLSFPLGVGIDTLTPRISNSQKQDNIDEVNGGNELWSKTVAEAVLALQPGQAMLTNLRVEIRRIKDPLAPTASAVNPHTALIANLSIF